MDVRLHVSVDSKTLPSSGLFSFPRSLLTLTVAGIFFNIGDVIVACVCRILKVTLSQKRQCKVSFKVPHYFVVTALGDSVKGPYVPKVVHKLIRIPSITRTHKVWRPYLMTYHKWRPLFSGVWLG